MYFSFRIFPKALRNGDADIQVQHLYQLGEQNLPLFQKRLQFSLINCISLLGMLISFTFTHKVGMKRSTLISLAIIYQKNVL